MIIPIRCFTCNRVLASKYNKYVEYVSQNSSKEENILSGDPDMEKIEENEQMKAFKIIGINDRYCCKRHILSHIDLLYKI